MNITELINIIREASKLMLNDFEISQKDGFSNIVTSSDIAVQKFLCERLAQLLPGSGFICEEEDINDATHEYTWIIDPIDGTANYSRGIGQCAICVGLRHNDHMEASVVYLPRTNELFHAEYGKGAFLNGKPIHVSDRPFQNGIMCTALAVYHKEYAKVTASQSTFPTAHSRTASCAPPSPSITRNMQRYAPTSSATPSCNATTSVALVPQLQSFATLPWDVANSISNTFYLLGTMPLHPLS